MKHGTRAGRRARVALAILSITWLGNTCEEREEGLALPTDHRAISGPLGVPIVQTGYENPIIHGFVRLDLSEMTMSRWTPESPLYEEHQTYSTPSRVRVTVGTQRTDAWLDVPRAPLDFQYEFPFAGPRLSLPMGGAPVTVAVDQDVAGSSPRRVDARRYALDPSVLVVPVHVTVFADAQGRLPYLGGRADVARAIVTQLFDPAGAAPAGFTLALRPGETRPDVSASRPHRFAHAAPDDIWHQCGIQFRAASVQVVSQSAGLERVLNNSTNPCGPTSSGPLVSHLRRPRDLGGVPFYVGGRMSSALLSQDLGAACALGSSNPFVAIDAEHLTTAGIVAHELGHFFLGPHHTSDPANVMSPPSRATRSIEGRTLTPEQCGSARCAAARFLRDLGLLGSAIDVDAECGIRRPVCGNGVIEPGEQCDHGGRPGNGCREDCTAARCGDGIVDAGEQCDWGRRDQRESCTIDCRACNRCNVCGDGVVGHGEDCDEGPNNGRGVCSGECSWTLACVSVEALRGAVDPSARSGEG